MRGTVSTAKKADDAKADPSAKKKADNTASSHTLLEGRLGYKLESALLVRALTHRSYAYENGGLPTNERLEFLGDSVLGLVVTDTLYTTHPDLPEGQLAKLRARWSTRVRWRRSVVVSTWAPSSGSAGVKKAQAAGTRRPSSPTPLKR